MIEGKIIQGLDALSICLPGRMSEVERQGFSEVCVEAVKLFATFTAERDRYREALERITSDADMSGWRMFRIAEDALEREE